MINPDSVAFIGQPPKADIKPKNTKLVFSDLIRASVRRRKGDIEFPMSLDTLDAYLRQKGCDQIDYAFLPEAATQEELQSGDPHLSTLGLRGQKQYPVRDAHLWGINMMNYLQAPEFFLLLRLAGVPALRTQRDENFPLIVLGGHIWPNPLPLAHFYDVLVAGDGENVLAQIAALIDLYQKDREQLLARIENLDGAYVPEYTSRPVRRATIDFQDPSYPAGGSYLLDGVGSVILSRGCAFSCAFCNNSLVGGQYRIKPVAQVKAHIDRLKQAGAHTIIPIAASASNYYSQNQTVIDIVKYIHEQGLALKRMSDRPERVTPEYLRLTTPKNGKVVIAPEASPRIRQLVFQKNIREETIQQAISACISAGINRLQLYVIVATPAIRPGVVDFLPTGFDGEQIEDLRYVAELGMSIVERMLHAGMQKPAGKPFVLLDCMPFIPAIGTLLQKAAFPSYHHFMLQIAALKTLIKDEYRGLVEVSAALDEETHLLQAFLERGDARVGDALWQVWQQNSAESLSLKEIRGAVLRSGIIPENLYADYLERRLPYEGLIEVT